MPWAASSPTGICLPCKQPVCHERVPHWRQFCYWGGGGPPSPPPTPRHESVSLATHFGSFIMEMTYWNTNWDVYSIITNTAYSFPSFVTGESPWRPLPSHVPVLCAVSSVSFSLETRRGWRGNAGEGVPAFLDQGYFCAMLSWQSTLVFWGLRAPDLPKQLCHWARHGKSQLETSLRKFRCKQANISRDVGPVSQAVSCNLQGPSHLFSWDLLQKGGHRSWLTWLPATVIQAGRHSALCNPAQLPCLSFPRGALCHKYLTIKEP